MRPPSAAACLLLLLTAPQLPAQEGGADETVVLEQAMQLVADGEIDRAVVLLRPVAAEADAAPQVRAVLGALLLEVGAAQEAYDLLQPMATQDGAEAAVLYNAGRAAAALGAGAEAVAFLERSLRAEPASPAARELGLLHAAVGRYAAAYPLLKPWAETNPDDRLATEIAALCAVQLERPVEAEVLLARLPQDEARVQLLWAQVRQLRGDPWGAIALLEPLLESTEGALQRDVRRLLAEAHTTVGNAAEAVALLEGHVEDDPVTSLQLARARYQSGDLDGALALLEPLAPPILARVEAEPASPVPPAAAGLLLEYGKLLGAADRSADALPYLAAGTRLAPDDRAGWQQLGQALAAAGRSEEAEAALGRFRELLAAAGTDAEREQRQAADLDDPTGRELRRAARLLEQQELDEALRIVRREAALAPSDPRPALLESRLLLVAGRTEEALALAEELVAALPDSADALYQRGVVRAAQGELAAAQSDLRAAIELAPEHTAAMSDLAVLLADQGEVAEARRLLERVLELRPGDAAATAALERLSDS